MRKLLKVIKWIFIVIALIIVLAILGMIIKYFILGHGFWDWGI